MSSPTRPADHAARLDRIDWAAVTEEINAYGCAPTPRSPPQPNAADISDLYQQSDRFRSTIDMARYRFGSGQYRYLDEPGADHTGGEFLMVEQRPRAQSRATSTLLRQGHGLIFTTRDRPVQSRRGWSAAPVRHGVSTIRSGIRHTLGLVSSTAPPDTPTRAPAPGRHGHPSRAPPCRKPPQRAPQPSPAKWIYRASGERGSGGARRPDPFTAHCPNLSA